MTVRPLFFGILLLLAGCERPPGRMDHAEDPEGRYREPIAAARRMLAQESGWAGRAEWEVVKTADGWTVTAWRVEHPENKGAARYVPWGYAVVELDANLDVVHYYPHG